MFVLNHPEFDAQQWALLGLLLGGLAAVFSLVACWVVLGRPGRWYQRAAIWLSLVVLLWVAGARVPTAAFVVQALALAGAWLVFRAVREKYWGEPSLHFTLSDTAAGLAVTAIVLTMLTRIDEPRAWWFAQVRLGAALAVWTLTATMTLWSARLRASPLLQLAVGLVGAACGAALFSPDALYFRRYPPRDWLYDGYWTQRALFAGAFVALLALQARLLFHSVALRKRPPPESRLGGALSLAVSCAALAAFLGIILYDPGMPQVPMPMPMPNGYDDLLALGREALAAGPANLGTWHVAERDDYLARTARARNEIQRALQSPAVVRLESDEGQAANAFGALARAMWVEGDVSAARGDYDAAFRAYLANVELAERLSHGGLLSHQMVGDSIRDELGIDPMRQLPDWPTGERFESLQRRLEAILSSAEPMESVYQRDRQFRQHVYRGLDRVYTFLDGFNPDHARQLHRGHDERRRSEIALLIAELALARHVELRGEAPATLEQLVPEFLQAVPLDAYSGAPLRYDSRPNGAYVVHSVGPNRIDDHSGRDDLSVRCQAQPQAPRPRP